MSSVNEMRKGFEHSFIDAHTSALEEYKPRLIINDYTKPEKVLTSIQAELNVCEEFFFSVAFVTLSGVTTLLNTLTELKERGIKGTIIASQYQNFSEPSALSKLLEYENLNVLVLTEDVAKLHTKGYIFRRGHEYSIIVGSSNLTQEALTKNKEWNLKVTGAGSGGLVREVLKDFQSLLSVATKIDKLWIDQYRLIYNERKRFTRSHEFRFDDPEAHVISLNRVVPNRMQKEALEALDETREKENRKALIISATGTGKTYLAAFDVKKMNPKRFLFVVHREQIAKAAMRSFKKVFDGKRSMGLLSGTHKEIDRDFVFATIQSISKEHNIQAFAPDAFDYIAIDEVHRAGAKSYQDIMKHFKPKFLLGMSATPERNDGFDIYQMFDYNYPYEIRLKDAMREDMICPFHYFGVSELVIDGMEIDEYTEFSKLTSDARVTHIIEKIKHYGFSGDRVKGLIFCSRNDEAAKLSEAFNHRGYRTVALSGKNTQDERVAAIERLEQKQSENALDYIFTVDIFNEGVDIPAINQVVMLRPTQSAIIFVQQLGRGLRHYPEKDFVVVLDFIGNYEGNFLIPIALSGDQSYNKDSIRRFVAEGNKVNPGPSTINLDIVTREKVYSAIDKARFNDVNILKESYFHLKQKLGHIPRLADFESNGAIDVERIFEKSGSYHNFLQKYEPGYFTKLNKTESLFLQYVSTKYGNGKRPHELECIKLLMEGHLKPMEVLKHLMIQFYGVELHEFTKQNIINQMKQEFLTGTGKKTYQEAVFANENQGELVLAANFKRALDNPDFKELLHEVICFGLDRYNNRFSAPYKGTSLQLYQKYTYEDVCRLLDWEQSLVPLNIGGYKFDQKTKTFPVFINYQKADVNHSINYEDGFLSPYAFKAISKSGRTVQSMDVQQIYNAEERGIRIYLFVRKNKQDDTSKEFYFLGEVKAVDEPKEFIMPNTTSTAVEIKYQMETQVREDIYDFLTTV